MKDYKKLLEVNKPARYINGEINSVHKSHEGRGSFCLIFPDVYEVGLSHIGFKMLYERLNNVEQIVCERFFMPWVDAIEKFGGDMFVSLESSTCLKDFDLLGFSVQYELAYSNMLKTLIESDIPVRSKDRDDSHPIVMAGGPCMVNPMPIADFMDAIYVGEAEEALPDVVTQFHEKKSNGANRYELLRFLNSFDFMYVPEIDDKKSVERLIHKNFHKDYTAKKLIVPTIPVVQDRVAVEISRGCTRGCRFCQAGMIYRPNRERSIDDVAMDALCQLENTGYLETSLLSLSASDYSKFEQLLVTMVKLTQERSISLSLPSIRADRIQEFIFRELSKVRKGGFTIAPEAGSQRMRDAVNKGLTEEQILDAVAKASDAGWNGGKLYFMIGLPGETMEDVLEIAEISKKAKALRKGRFSIRVSVSNFVPKPHTPYQWSPQNSGDEFFEKKRQLREIMKKYKIPCSFHGIKTSVLEGAFARGGRELGNVIESAVRRGAIFDAWSEHFDGDIWSEAFAEFGYAVSDFSQKAYAKDEALPWDHICVGIDKKFLWDEFEKSEKLEFTPDCTDGKCTACGVCDFKEIKNQFSEESVIDTTAEKIEKEHKRYALVFSKRDRLSLLSAIETQRLFTHVLTIAKVGLRFSQGFNPQPKLSYVQAGSTGLTGLNEVLLFEACDISDREELKDKLNSILPPGVDIKAVQEFNDNPKYYEAYVRFRYAPELFKIFRDKYLQGEAEYKKLNKKGKEKVMNAADFVVRLGDDDVVFKTEGTGNFNSYEFFESLGYKRSEIDLERVNVYLLKRTNS